MSVDIPPAGGPETLRGGLVSLHRLLREIDDGLRGLYSAGLIATPLDTVGLLHLRVAQAIANGSADEQRTVACQVSGIRKGISELGIIDRTRDEAITALIDRAADLALSLCLS